MSDAVDEIKSSVTSVTGITTDIGISCDGSWQRRGYSSMNGVVTVISMDNGKILDSEPMSRHCRECKKNEPLKTSNPDVYKDWLANHECNISCCIFKGQQLA